jgi:hypothetical protein
MLSMRCGYTAGLALLLGLLVAPAGESQVAIWPETPPPPRKPPVNRFYASVGVGILNIDRGVGVDLPLGFTAALGQYRLLATARLLDIGLLEGNDRDPRYYHPYFGSSLCADSQSGRSVPNYYCSGGTDGLLSSAVDLSYVLLDEVWIGDQPGKLFAGLGHRFSRPQTFYGTIGLYFDSRSRDAGGIKLAIGRDYVNMGIVWGWDLARIFRRR